MHFTLDKMRKNFLQGIDLTIKLDLIYFTESAFVYVLLVFPLLSKVHIGIKIYISDQYLPNLLSFT